MSILLDQLKSDLAVGPDLAVVTVLVPGKDPIALNIGELASALGVFRVKPVTILYTGYINSTQVHGRAAPGLTGVIVIPTFPYGAAVDVYSNPPEKANNLDWLHVNYNGVQCWVAKIYVGVTPISPVPPTVPPPVVPPVPTKTANRIGFHWLNDGAPPSVTEALSLAQRLHAIGKSIAAATIVNHAGLAVALSQCVGTVVARFVLTDHDPSPVIPQNEAGAIAAGRAWVDDHILWLDQIEARSGVYIQWANETGFDPFDYAFNLGIMQRCDELGHKAAIFADSVGTPNVDQWIKRIPALRYAQANGHIVANHAYGNNNPDNTPVSSPTGAQWFGLRYRDLYNAVPIDCRPGLVISECGLFNAVFPGTDAILADMQGYAAEISQDKFVLGACWWTLGGTSADKWAKSNWYAALDQYEAWLNK